MQYGLLFRIECLHAYFGGGPCRSLTLSPTDDCRRLMARYQMLFRGVAGGGAVYCPQQTPPDLLKQFDEIAAFTFTLISSDPAFNSYTEINESELNIRESIFHFDNRKDYSEELFGQRRQLLHQPGKPFTQGALPVRPRVSQIPPRADGGEFKILDPLAHRPLIKGAFAPKEAPTCLDLRSFPEGLYSLQLADDPNHPPQAFYLSDQSAVRRWGVVSIYAGGHRQTGDLPDNCAVIDSDGVVHAKTFTVALAARKTIWRYYVIPSGERQNVGEYQVVTAGKKPSDGSAVSGNDLEFKLLAGTTPIDGRAAWVFESTKELPYLLSPASSFALALRPSKNGQPGQRAIRLPYAQPASLTKVGAEPEKMYSDIFVYL
jgi:hypothetical protein